MKGASMKCVAILMVIFASMVEAQNIPLRPDMPEGLPGALIRGGRGATAFYGLDTLTDDSWVGGTVNSDSIYTRCSYRYFIEDAPEERRVGFWLVRGVVEAEAEFTAVNGNFSLLGQTAGGPIIIKNYRTIIREEADSTYFAHMRFYTTDNVAVATSNCEQEGIEYRVRSTATEDLIGGVTDHCSFGFGTDALTDIRNQNPSNRAIDKILGIWNLYFMPMDSTGGAINTTPPPDSCSPATDQHAYAFGCGVSNQGALDASKGIGDVTLYQNAFIHFRARAPQMNANGNFINNAVYNPIGGATEIRNEGDPAYLARNFNIIANYYKKGPATLNGTYPIEVGTGDPDVDTLANGAKYYVWGNVYDDNGFDPWPTPYINDQSMQNHKVFTSQNLSFAGVPVLGAEEAFDYVMAHAGATPVNRPAIESTVFADARSNTGNASTYVNHKGIPRNMADVLGGFPVISGSGTKQTRFRLPAFPNGDDDSDGYLSWEEAVWTFTMDVENQSSKKTLKLGYYKRHYPWMMDTMVEISEFHEQNY